MSFLFIFIGVMIILAILAIVFAVLHFVVALLPAALIVAGIIWLVYYFTKRKPDKKPRNSGNKRGKEPENVSVKDIKD